LFDAGRIPLQTEVQQKRPARHGQLAARRQRQSVLLHAGGLQRAEQEAHAVRQGRGRHRLQHAEAE